MISTEKIENEISDNIEVIDELEVVFKDAQISLLQFIESKSHTCSSLGKELGMGNYLYEVVSFNKKKKISRDSLLKVLIYLQADLVCINRMLQSFSHSKIYVKIQRDAIMYFCIKNNYTLEQTNEQLYTRNMNTL